MHGGAILAISSQIVIREILGQAGVDRAYTKECLNVGDDDDANYSRLREGDGAAGPDR